MFSNIVIEATQQVVPVEFNRANQMWMANYILNMIPEGRLLKFKSSLKCILLFSIMNVYIGMKMLKSSKNVAKQKK